MRAAGEPRRAAGIKPLDLGPPEPGHVLLHLVADAGLQIGEVTVALGELGQELGVEGELGGGIDRIEPVLLIDRLAQHDTPAPVPLLEEIIEPAGADHVAQDAVDGGALHDLHLGLRHGARAGKLDRAAAEKMENADAALPTLAAHLDEALGRALEPRGHHPAILVPRGAERLPIAAVAPDGPVLDDFADAQLLRHLFSHGGSSAAARTRDRAAALTPAAREARPRRRRHRCGTLVLVAEIDAALGEIVGRHLHRDAVPGENADAIFFNLAGD